MPISSGALGWPRSYWAPPKRRIISRKKVYPHAIDWARHRAEELKQRNSKARRKDKSRKKTTIKRDRRKLKKRCLIAILIVVVILVLGAAGFLLWWFIFKDNPNCRL